MAVKLSVTVRNARLDAIETAVGVSAILKGRSARPPHRPTARRRMPARSWRASPCPPTGWRPPPPDRRPRRAPGAAQADAAGTAGHFRIYTGPAGTVCHLQGTVTATGGGGDLTLDNAVIAAAQSLTITGFTLTDGNA